MFGLYCVQCQGLLLVILHLACSLVEYRILQVVKNLDIQHSSMQYLLNMCKQ